MSNDSEQNKYEIFIGFLKKAGLDHIRNGSITLHFDRFGNCKAINTNITMYVAKQNSKSNEELSDK